MPDATNNAATQTPATPPVAPTIAPSSAPDLSSLVAPGAQSQPNLATAVQNTIAPYEQAAQQATQQANQLASQPVTPQPVPGVATGPHARLLNMVQGLALGADAFGKAIATHGREGGVQEVEQANAQKQAMQQSAQQAAREQRNSEIQQKLITADSNQKLAQNVLLLSTLPTDLQLKDLDVQAKTQGLQKGTIDIQNARNESIQQFGIDPLSASTPAGAANNATGAAKVVQQLIGFASDPRVLGPNDPAVKDAQTNFAAAQATGDPTQIMAAAAGLRRAIDFHQQQVESGIKAGEAAKTAPLGDRATAINAAMLRRYQVLNPGAKTLPPDLSLSASSTPDDFNRIDKVLQQTENAQSTQASRDLSNALHEQTMKLTAGGGTGNATQTGKDYLKTLTPARAAEVQAIGEGRIATTANTFRSPAGQALLADVTQAYPDYDQSKANAYNSMRKDFTSGRTAAGINSLNTVANHLSRMYDHTSAVSTLPGVSGAARAFGSEQAAALNSDRQGVSTELAKAYANGQISEGEIKAWESRLNVWSPVELRNNIKEVATLLEGKLSAYQNQWSNGMPSGVVTPVQIISPAAQASLDHIKGTTSDIVVSDPGDLDRRKKTGDFFGKFGGVSH